MRGREQETGRSHIKNSRRDSYLKMTTFQICLFILHEEVIAFFRVKRHHEKPSFKIIYSSSWGITFIISWPTRICPLLLAKNKSHQHVDAI